MTFDKVLPKLKKGKWVRRTEWKTGCVVTLDKLSDAFSFGSLGLPLFKYTSDALSYEDIMAEDWYVVATWEESSL